MLVILSRTGIAPGINDRTIYIHVKGVNDLTAGKILLERKLNAPPFVPYAPCPKNPSVRVFVTMLTCSPVDLIHNRFYPVLILPLINLAYETGDKASLMLSFFLKTAK